MKWPDDFINKVICGDCLEILPQIPDGAVDAVVTDPPYGIGLDTDNAGRGRGRLAKANCYPRIAGDNKPFDPDPFIKRFYSIPMFIFGANYFHRLLPQSGGWFVWDKTGGGFIMNDNADIELIWTNVTNTPRIFHHLWSGMMKDSDRGVARQHPTQKPVPLLSWIIEKWTEENGIILDCFAGSGSTLVAAKQLGRRYIGIEIEPKYCKIAEDRLRQEILL